MSAVDVLGCYKGGGTTVSAFCPWFTGSGRHRQQCLPLHKMIHILPPHEIPPDSQFHNQCTTNGLDMQNIKAGGGEVGTLKPVCLPLLVAS
jgi:hypothetical protein